MKYRVSGSYWNKAGAKWHYEPYICTELFETEEEAQKYAATNRARGDINLMIETVEPLPCPTPDREFLYVNILSTQTL